VSPHKTGAQLIGQPESCRAGFLSPAGRGAA
jgi:hypothetical protein